VKRFGKRVVVVFWENSGLNPESRRAADEFIPVAFENELTNRLGAPDAHKALGVKRQ
jgi:hypothetical protein